MTNPQQNPELIENAFCDLVEESESSDLEEFENAPETIELSPRSLRNQKRTQAKALQFEQEVIKREQQREKKQKMAEAARLQQVEARLAEYEQKVRDLENAPPPNAQPQVGGENLFPAGGSVRPTVFKGGYNPTFSEWINRFEEIAAAHHWDNTRKTELIHLFLEGGARLAYRSLPDATKKDYPLLKTALMKALEPVESPRFFSQLLYGPKARKLQPGENVSTFAEEIQRYTRGAHPVTRTFSLDAQNDIMREVFIGGLPHTMRAAILDKEPASFEQALQIATKLEARDYLLKGETPNDLKTYQSYQTFGVNTKGFQHIHQQMPQRQFFPPKRNFQKRFFPNKQFSQPFQPQSQIRIPYNKNRQGNISYNPRNPPSLNQQYFSPLNNQFRKPFN